MMGLIWARELGLGAEKIEWCQTVGLGKGRNLGKRVHEPGMNLLRSMIPHSVL